MNEENTHKYDDIVNLPHPTSSKHPRMSLYDRAAQFSPFAALTGHDEAVKETARQTDRRIELDEVTISKLNAKINIIEDNLGEDVEVTVTYFVPDERKEGGSYQAITGRVKRLDEYESAVVMTDGRKISLEQIYDIESTLFEGIEF